VAGFQWLSQHLQYLAIKLWKLIEEQHAMVGESDFAGLRFRAAVGFRNKRESARLGPSKQSAPFSK
jgi:hypothetical protein